MTTSRLVIFTVVGDCPKPAFGTPHFTPSMATIGLLGSPSEGRGGAPAVPIGADPAVLVPVIAIPAMPMLMPVVPPAPIAGGVPPAPIDGGGVEIPVIGGMMGCV